LHRGRPSDVFAILRIVAITQITRLDYDYYKRLASVIKKHVKVDFEGPW
jgi:hypothetical protein